MRTPLAGSTPNVHWRYVDTEELRAHPRYSSLPPVSSLELCGPASFRWIRQEEPLWDAVHEGVLTSRHLISVLGFREPAAARSLGLSRAMESPDAMRRVYDELRNADPQGIGRSVPSCALSGFEASAVTAAATRNAEIQTAWAEVRRAHAGAWPPPRRNPPPRRRGDRAASISSVRCAWGSAQEAAALAAVLQYDEAATMEEIGLAMVDPANMPTEELRAAAAAGELPPIGASPDAMLQLGGGAAMEPLEVKNTCPFYTRRDHDGYLVHPERLTGKALERAKWFEVRGPHESVAAQYIPQVQLEMLATGATAGHYCSMSAAHGLNLFRITRDDAYLEKLLLLVRRFWLCVRRGEPPPPLAGSEEHAAFIEHTLALVKASEGARRHVSEPWRHPLEGDFFLDRKRAGKA